MASWRLWNSELNTVFCVGYRQPLVARFELRVGWHGGCTPNCHVNAPSQRTATSGAVSDDPGGLFVVRIDRPVVNQPGLGREQGWSKELRIAFFGVNVREVLANIRQQWAS